MKNLFFTCFVLVTFFGFAQNRNTKTQPLFVSTIGFTDFNSVSSDLNKLSLSIMGKTLVLDSIDDIRQGQLVISTANFGKSLKNIKIDMQPSLEIELERVMFTGNFINPNRPLILCFD